MKFNFTLKGKIRLILKPVTTEPNDIESVSKVMDRTKFC